MSPRVQANKVQKRLRAPRIPKISSDSVLFPKALTKMIFIFDQGFFIAHVSRVAALLRIVVFEKLAFQKSTFQKSLFKKSLFKEIFPQFYICFPTSVL